MWVAWVPGGRGIPPRTKSGGVASWLQAFETEKISKLEPWCLRNSG